MTPEEDFLGSNAPSCQDFQSLRPPLLWEFPVCHPSGGDVDFFWNNPIRQIVRDCALAVRQTGFSKFQEEFYMKDAWKSALMVIRNICHCWNILESGKKARNCEPFVTRTQYIIFFSLLTADSYI